ncbi:MAG: glycosyltransferase family 2 protein [Candidatus Aenigmarchaeota archaeon]|nr:glycosyltransferase family 2 protein [Candidatus Aenigmarchaeota archaeon]
MSLAFLSYLWMFILIPLVFLCSLGMLIQLSKKPSLVTKQPKLTFIVAVWNEGRRVAKCVNSILTQNYPVENIRIIVVGGGNQETVEECKKLAGEHKIEYMMEKERRGKWFALNTALKKVKTDYVAFTDADCVLEKDWLKKMLTHDADIVVADYLSISEKTLKGKFYAYVLYIGPRLSEGLNKFLRNGEFIGIGSLVKSKVFEKIKFRNSFIEDWWFVEDAKKRNFSVEHSTAKTYEHAPETLNGLRKGLLRLSKGFVLEAMSMGNASSIFMSAFYIIAALSIPFNIYQIISGSQFAINSILLTIFSLAVFSLVCSIKYKNYRFIFYSPMMIPLMAFTGLFSLEAVVKMLFGREIKWEIYNKTGK